MYHTSFAYRASILLSALAVLNPFTATAQSACVSAPAGLVSWWPGDNDALDWRGPNHGTLRSGAAFSAGKVGSGFLFDGVDDVVEAPTAGLNVGTGDFSVEG